MAEQEEQVRYEVRGPAAWATIDRPERRNAISGEVVSGLRSALARAGEDDEVRALVVTGAGDQAFCAGGDLGGSGLGGAESRVAQHERRSELHALLVEVQACPKPVIARVNGKALGGGFGMMLGCDLAVAADDVEVGTPEVNLGMWPFIITAVIQRNVPRKIALEMMMTGRRVSAEEALRWGMVNRVVPRAALDTAVDELVAELAAKSPLVLRLGKRSFYRAQDLAFADAVEYLNAMLTVNLESEDVVEGVSAFLEKRTPQWRGR